MPEPKCLFELLLVRHAQSCGNAGIVSGESAADRYDSALSDDGMRQAKLLAARFAQYPLDALFSSGLIRAAQTASEIAAAQPPNGAKRVQILPLLTECNVGEDYTGRPIQTLQTFCPAAELADGWQDSQTVLPNDEELDGAYNIARAQKTLALFRQRFQNGERVMAVAHGIFNTILLMQALGVDNQMFDPDFANTSVTRLAFYETGTGPWGFDVRLRELNDYSHLHAAFPRMRYEIKETVT